MGAVPGRARSLKRWCFTNKNGLCPDEVEHQYVSITVSDADRHGVWRQRIFRMQRVVVYAVAKFDDPIGSAHVNVVQQVATLEELHAHARREVKRGIGMQHAPRAE